MKARKLTEPTGRPVRMVEPTGRHASDRGRVARGVVVTDVSVPQRRATGGDSTRGKPARRECKHCGQVFAPETRWRTCCSRECAQQKLRRGDR